MSTATATSAADDYLAAVSAELADLPEQDRVELVEDLALHLAALAEEDDDRPLAARLGAPAAYAAELRAAAGLPSRTAPSRTGRPLAPRVAEAARRGLAEVRAFLPELVPGWWVLRGYLVVLVPCLLGTDGQHDVPVPAPWGSHALGVLLVLAAVVGSVAVGRRVRTHPPRLFVLVADVVVVAAALSLAADAPWRLSPVTGTTADGPGATQDQPLVSVHGPVTDVFPYAADGTPLDGVLLYDQDGRPLHVGQQHWWADGCERAPQPPRAADGVAVTSSYPQRYAPAAGQGASCAGQLPRPQVPLPTFPPAG